jgi:hypothetical protein
MYIRSSKFLVYLHHNMKFLLEQVKKDEIQRNLREQKLLKKKRSVSNMSETKEQEKMDKKFWS